MPIEDIIADLKKSIERSRTMRAGVNTEEHMKQIRRIIKEHQRNVFLSQPRRGEKDHGFLVIRSEAGAVFRIPCWVKE